MKKATQMRRAIAMCIVTTSAILQEDQMTIYAISYDLNKAKDYQKLWDALKASNAHRILESVWLMDVKSDWTPAQLLKWLEQYVDSDDSLFVAKTTKAGLTFKNAKSGTNDWLKNKT